MRTITVQVTRVTDGVTAITWQVINHVGDLLDPRRLKFVRGGLLGWWPGGHGRLQ